MNYLFFCLVLLLSPLLYLSIGARFNLVAGILLRKVCRTAEVPILFPSPSYQMLVGLLLSLTCTFFLWHFGLPLAYASALPFLCAFRTPRSFVDLFPSESLATLSKPGFIIWWLVITVIGSTIIDVPGGIFTAWSNNFGDITFHLGMITSFVFGENATPEYHIYAGETLSYPFFVNLWSAALWWIDPRFETLPILFLYQWVLCFSLLYFFVGGAKRPLLPWMILFGGGSYLALGMSSGAQIDSNLPWTNFLTTIWIPQRSAMFGVVVLAGVISLFLRRCEENATPIEYLGVGVLLALMPLVHMHFLLGAGSFCVLFALLSGAHAPTLRTRGKKALCVALPGALGLVFSPWFIGKRGIVNFVQGWSTGPLDAASQGFAASAQVWFSLSTVTVWLMLLIAIGSSKRYRLQSALILLFLIVGNLVSISVWPWDQIKIFIGLYVLSLVVWSFVQERWLRRLDWLVLLFIFPTLYELYPIAIKVPHYEVYTKMRVEEALVIRAHTSPEDILVANPLHNSVVTLTGRRSWYGYEGTLYSHALPYNERYPFMQNLSRMHACNVREMKACPTVLIWGEEEQKYFHQQAPGREFVPSDISFIYRFPVQ